MTDLRQSIHEFIDEIVRTGEDPLYWPLSADERTAFVRQTIAKAIKIARSEPYMAEDVKMKAERLVEHTKTRPK